MWVLGMRVLGTCATKNGSMQQLAEAIAATLRASELGVDVLRARGGCLPPAWAYGGARITAVAVRGGSMTIVVGYVPTETGFSAIKEAEREARTRDIEVVVST